MSEGAQTNEDAWTVQRHLDGKPEGSVAMFHRFVELVAACGPCEVSPSKSSVTFKGTRRGFAGARPTVSGLVVYLDLQRALESPRVRSVSPYTSRLFVHHLKLTSVEDVDDELAGRVAEAYEVGAGAHLRGRRPDASSSTLSTVPANRRAQNRGRWAECLP